MKVLMLGWELPPHNSGGLGVACYQICKKLSQKNIDITFALPYESDHDCDFMEIISADVVSVKNFIGVYDGADLLADESITRSATNNIFDIQNHYANAIIEKVVKGREFDVIHAHDWLTFRAGLRAREVLNIPLIVHVHSVESDRAGNNPGHSLVREIEEIGFLLSDQIVAVSEYTKSKIVKEYDIPPSKIVVAHNYIDYDLLPSLDSDNIYRYLSALKEQGYKVVVNVGRHTIQKGLDNLLYAAEKVVSQQPKTIFLLVGNGELYHQLIRLGAELGISRNLIFADFQRGKKWRDAFGVAELVLMPSVSEPFGLTPLEAAIYDTPSLISKQSGVSEVLNNCLKVDFWDVDKMADQIVNVLSYDAMQKELLGNVRAELPALNWDKTINKLITTYNSHVRLA